jgi:hypothetical protein
VFHAILLGLVACAAPSADSIKTSATLASESLEVGKSYEITFQLDVPDDLSVPVGKKMKHSPILQLKVPSSVRLEGKHLSTYAETRGNEFLEAPFERLIEFGTSTVKFKLGELPKAGDSIGIVVTAFFESEKKGNAFFFRRRLQLPVKAGAKAVLGESDDSSWGVDDKVLSVGQKAPLFELPLADGSGDLPLSKYVGKKNIIITTYRAFW